MMEKYGVDERLVQQLLQLGLAATREDALVKVASGQAVGLVKEARKVAGLSGQVKEPEDQ